MATIDPEKDSLVIRLVYDGPPTSGKTTTLRALAQQFGGRPVFTPEELSGRTLYFDYMEYTGGSFEGRPIHCQVVSVPGQVELGARRQLILESADAVVFVADSSPTGFPRSLEHLEDLRARLASLPSPSVGVVLQANKRDLPDAVSLQPLRASCDLAVIESVAAGGEGIREAFVFAVRLALDRAREQMQSGGLSSSAPASHPEQELLAQMQALPTVTLSPAFSGTPTLPDAMLPSGWIWPPVGGRIQLQEAARGGIGPLVEVAPGEWMADSATGWRFYSPASGYFSDGAAAKAALLRLAKLHHDLEGWLSPHRTVALSEAGDGGWRLWQVVRGEPSIWHLLGEAFQTGDDRRIADALALAESLCEAAAARWEQSPMELPCSLETVGPGPTGSGEPVYVGLMPELAPPHAPEAIDRRALLWRELSAWIGVSPG